jgi:rod shape-determining protein MreD
MGFSVLGAVAAVTPFLCGLLGAALANIPISILGGLVPPPLFALMPVYFWCLMRPDLMPPWAALMIGATEDLLSGGPMGVWAASFVVVYLIVDRERDAFAGLAGIGAILGFGSALLVACGVAYSIVALTYGRLLPIEPLILTMVTSIVFYFPALALLNLLYHRFIGPLRSGF